LSGVIVTNLYIVEQDAKESTVTRKREMKDQKTMKEVH
jgi:hypothetical protein